MLRHRALALIAPALLALAACAATACSGSNDTGAGGSGSSASTSTSSGAGGESAGPTLITTADGPVQGTVIGETRAFLGIPFAAPPVGDLRWKPPQPHAKWTNPIDASAVGPACAQLTALSPAFDTTSSEDCLTLNIWAPKKPSASPLPVMVWIYGGSFVIGSGGSPDYDGQKLSEATGAVIVTINYRLGPLGFLASAALHAEDPAHPSSGDYGLEDQRAALGWVKANIAAFGGDAKNVTIFGESAGGISTCLHLISPASGGLFHRAIIESGACAQNVVGKTEAAAQTDDAELIKALGCDGKDPATELKCLRAKKPEDVLLAIPASPLAVVGPGLHWFPVIDGVNIPDDPTKVFAAGNINKVPTMLGSNANEGTIFFAFQSPVTDDASYLMVADQLVPGHGADIVAHYPSAMYGSAKDAAAAAFGDAGFVCPARATAQALAKAQVPTYLYQFTHASDGALLMGLGAFHSSEIPFVFGNPSSLLPKAPLDAELPLVAIMDGYWGRMAKAGDPNGGGAFAWPKYDPATDENIVLDLKVSKQSGLKKADCAFWATLSP